MAVRTALLTSRNINLDTDFSKYIESVTDAGIISGFTVTASSVAAGTAWVPCTRTNLETIYALVQNFSAVSISGNGYVIIKVDDTIVDNGGGNEDGTGIATIEVVATLPSKNYLHLATITNGTVTMVAPTIKKLNELDTQIQSIFTQLADLDERVEHLEEADAIDHLEESGLVWELYTLNDTLFKQYAPTLANSTLEANVGDVAANTQIHIQAMGSGVASNQLKLKVKMAWAPTTSLKVEVRKGIQVTVTANSEAYWYGGGDLLATGTLASSSFSNDWAEVTFNLDNEVGGTKWELLDVVVYQTTGSGATVNASNYYVLACDSTQYSEAFSYVSVNGSTRARSKLMPYLSSDGFVQAMLSKVNDTNLTVWDRSNTYGAGDISGGSSSSNVTVTYITLEAPFNGNYVIDFNYSLYNNGWPGANVYLYVNGEQKKSTHITPSTWGTTSGNYHNNLSGIKKGDIIEVKYSAHYTSTSTRTSITATDGTISVTPVLFKNWLPVKPRKIDIIGKQTELTLYGIHTDNIYYGGIMLEKDTSATTWEITPGNFVGYIKVNFNGEIIKIPYYRE